MVVTVAQREVDPRQRERNVLVNAVRFVLWVFFRVFYRVRWRYPERVPMAGPVILAPTHRYLSRVPAAGTADPGSQGFSRKSLCAVRSQSLRAGVPCAQRRRPLGALPRRHADVRWFAGQDPVGCGGPCGRNGRDDRSGLDLWRLRGLAPHAFFPAILSLDCDQVSSPDPARTDFRPANASGKSRGGFGPTRTHPGAQAARMATVARETGSTRSAGGGALSLPTVAALFPKPET